MKKLLPLIGLSLLTSLGFSQGIGVGQWRTHLPYTYGISVAEGNGKVFCATPNSLFAYHKSDGGIQLFSKINGLSDVEPNRLSFNAATNTFIVAYKNANVDLIQNNSIINLSDIKRANIIGNKTINGVYSIGKNAYLSCGFGIVVMDVDKKEIKDTYYIGTNGGYINVRDIASDGLNLYAATDSGVYSASLSNPNLANYTAWTKFSTLPQGIYNTIDVTVNGKVFVNYSQNLMTGANNQDSIYVYNGISWVNAYPGVGQANTKRIRAYPSKMMMVFNGYVDFFDLNGVWTGDRIYTYGSLGSPNPQDIALDSQNSNLYWIADGNKGLIRNTAVWSDEQIIPNGPKNARAQFIYCTADDDLWCPSGEISDGWIGNFNTASIHRFKNESWNTIDASTYPAMDSIRDLVSAVIDPKDPNHAFSGSLGFGLLEFKNGAYVKLYNEVNSSLRSRPEYHWVGVSGLAYDADGNLWIANSLTPQQPVSVLKTDGTWQNFSAGTAVQNAVTHVIIVAKDGTKWVALPRSNGGGLMAFSENGTFSNTSDDKIKRLSTASGNGLLPSNDVFALAEDQDGQIWIGTDKGVAVCYSPENVFSGSNFDFQPIYVQQDGHTQLLLETEVVSCMAVDGANRKWFGTRSAGVFLMSSDGTKQVYHFTAENSPLLSNDIRTISINPKSGEVFFGTSEGIISYRSTATEGGDDFENVYAFPNPVRPGYGGVVAIRGLVKNADVKITDISGTLIYQTRALGGQAIWDCKNFSGQRANSGVYLVFCSNDDGSKTFVTKILVVN